MSDLEFGATSAEQLATLLRVVRDLHRDIYGNGQLGLKTKAELFMAEYEGVRKEQERQHEANSRKLNILMVIATMILALMATGTLLIAISPHDRSRVVPLLRQHSRAVLAYWSKTPLDSRLPEGMILP